MLSDVQERLLGQKTDRGTKVLIGLDKDIERVTLPVWVIYRTGEKVEKNTETTLQTRQRVAQNFAVLIVTKKVGTDKNAFEVLEEHRAEVLTALKGWVHPNSAGEPTLFVSGQGVNVPGAEAAYLMTFKTIETI